MIQERLQCILTGAIVSCTVGVDELKFIKREGFVVIREQGDRTDLKRVGDGFELTGFQIYVSFFVFSDGSPLNTYHAAEFLSGQAKLFAALTDFFTNCHNAGPPFPKLIVTEKFYFYKKKFLTRNKCLVYYVSS